MDHDLRYSMILTFANILVSISVAMYRCNIVVSEKVQHYGSSLKFFAGISYPLYLLHKKIGYFIIRMLENAGMVNEVVILVPFFIVIVLAWLIYRFVEIPMTKVGLRASEKYILCVLCKKPISQNE